MFYMLLSHWLLLIMLTVLVLSRLNGTNGWMNVMLLVAWLLGSQSSLNLLQFTIMLPLPTSTTLRLVSHMVGKLLILRGLIPSMQTGLQSSTLMLLLQSLLSLRDLMLLSILGMLSKDSM